MSIKISHNKRLFWIIIFLIILLIILIYFILNSEDTEIAENGGIGEIANECQIDSDCVPASCCHPESCVTLDNAPDCSGMFCSQVCLGPLDCGAGNCGCVKGKCEVSGNQ